MASTIQLKRSAQSGKVPDTGSLNLGELAINTYDGKIYFKKSGSIESVESVLTTNSTVTGSIRLEGTGSFGSLKVNDTLTVNHGEAIISGSALVTSDLTILGAVNARQFNISIISSSVLFQSGSTKFGDTSDDTHSFTGSVSISGSLTTIGTITGTSFNGTIAATNGVVSGAAQILITELDGFADYNDGILTDIGGKEEIASSTHTLVSGSSQLTSSFDERYSLSGSGVSSGPNTFDFNLDPEAAGTVNFIEDSTGNTQAIARTGSFDILIGSNTHLSVSASAINVTTGSITANYMHLAKYISESGDLDFNI